MISEDLVEYSGVQPKLGVAGRALPANYFFLPSFSPAPGTFSGKGEYFPSLVR
jgi:hypothetical protein